MYEIIIGEISEGRKKDWFENDSDPQAVLKETILKKECSIATLSAAAKIFHDEVQIDWGCFAWKAFKSDLRKFFKRKGLPEAELAPFDEFKEYGVVYIDR